MSGNDPPARDEGELGPVGRFDGEIRTPRDEGTERERLRQGMTSPESPPRPAFPPQVLQVDVPGLDAILSRRGAEWGPVETETVVAWLDVFGREWLEAVAKGLIRRGGAAFNVDVDGFARDCLSFYLFGLPKRRPAGPKHGGSTLSVRRVETALAQFDPALGTSQNPRVKLLVWVRGAERTRSAFEGFVLERLRRDGDLVAVSRQPTDAGGPNAPDSDAFLTEIRDMVAALPGALRDVYLCRYEQNLDPADIATKLEISVPAVHQRLHRLKEEVARRLDFDPVDEFLRVELLGKRPRLAPDVYVRLRGRLVEEFQAFLRNERTREGTRFVENSYGDGEPVFAIWTREFLCRDELCFVAARLKVLDGLSENDILAAIQKANERLQAGGDPLRGSVDDLLTRAYAILAAMRQSEGNDR